MKITPTIDDVKTAIENTNLRAELSATPKHKLIAQYIELLAMNSLLKLEQEEKKVIMLQ